MSLIEIPLPQFDAYPPSNVRDKTQSDSRVKVTRKVFFCFEPEALLNPDGVLGQYKIEFRPEGRDPFIVVPEPKAYYTLEVTKERVQRLLTSFTLGFYLEYWLFGEKPTSIGFGT